MNQALDLPVANYDLEHPIESIKSPDLLLAERKSSSRFNLDRSLQKSLRSKLQTPKVSLALSERRSIEDIDHNATMNPIQAGYEGSQLLEGDEEDQPGEVIQGEETLQQDEEYQSPTIDIA